MDPTHNYKNAKSLPQNQNLNQHAEQKARSSHGNPSQDQSQLNGNGRVFFPIPTGGGNDTKANLRQLQQRPKMKTTSTTPVHKKAISKSSANQSVGSHVRTSQPQVPGILIDKEKLQKMGAQ